VATCLRPLLQPRWLPASVHAPPSARSPCFGWRLAGVGQCNPRNIARILSQGRVAQRHRARYARGRAAARVREPGTVCRPRYAPDCQDLGPITLTYASPPPACIPPSFDPTMATPVSGGAKALATHSRAMADELAGKPMYAGLHSPPIPWLTGLPVQRRREPCLDLGALGCLDQRQANCDKHLRVLLRRRRVLSVRPAPSPSRTRPSHSHRAAPVAERSRSTGRSPRVRPRAMRSSMSTTRTSRARGRPHARARLSRLRPLRQA
jgi:hypothetical protein